MEVVDKDRFNMITGGDEAAKKEIFMLFEQTVVKNAELMGNMADKEGEWHSYVHEIKGAADNIGFRKLGGICKQAEESKNYSEEEKKSVLQDIKNSLDEIRSELGY